MISLSFLSVSSKKSSSLFSSIFKFLRQFAHFLGAQSFSVRKRLQSCIRSHLPYCSLRIIFQSKSRLSSLFSFKDIIPIEISTQLVYKSTCSCCNATYYGKSERHFFVRASEHLGMTALTGNRVKNPIRSAISFISFIFFFCRKLVSSAITNKSTLTIFG